MSKSFLTWIDPTLANKLAPRVWMIAIALRILVRIISNPIKFLSGSRTWITQMLIFKCIWKFRQTIAVILLSQFFMADALRKYFSLVQRIWRIQSGIFIWNFESSYWMRNFTCQTDPHENVGEYQNNDNNNEWEEIGRNWVIHSFGGHLPL